jgi:esterase/lipase
MYSEIFHKLMLIAGLSLASSFVLAESSTNNQSRYHWQLSKIGPIKGVVLVLHGLNLKPEKMIPLSESLNDNSYHILNGKLTGHNGTEAEFRRVTRDVWLKDMKLIYFEAYNFAKKENLPLYFVGYSLGALLGLDFANQNFPEIKNNPALFQKSVLLAPAISLNLKTKLIKLITYLPFDIILPSVARDDYRANIGGTPIAGYTALFESEAHLNKIGITAKEPTLIIMDPEDELVNYDGILHIIEKNHLKNWSILNVNNQNSKMTEGKYHHLVIDSLSVGTQEWNRIVNAIQKHFQ